MCRTLTLRHKRAHPQISQSICHTPLTRLSQRAGCSNETLVACVLPPRSEPWHSATFCLLSDATMHPPVSKTHPYENQDPASMPHDMGYGYKMVDGVMHVYTTRNIMEKWDIYDESLACLYLDVVGCLSVFRLSSHILLAAKSFLLKFWCRQQEHRAGPAVSRPAGIHRWYERHDGPHYQRTSVRFPYIDFLFKWYRSSCLSQFFLVSFLFSSEPHCQKVTVTCLCFSLPQKVLLLPSPAVS